MVANKITDWLKGPKAPRWRRDPNLSVIRGVVHRAGTGLVGLKGSLARVLWPTYEHCAAPRLANFGHAPEVGLLIEDQVEAWFRGSTWGEGGYTKVAKDPRRKEARVICGLMVALGLRRVDSQAPVAHGRVGTRLDWVVADPSGKLLLLELKTGFNNGLRNAQGELLGFPGFKSHREQHAYFQLLWTWAALERQGVKTEPWLVIVNKTAKDKFGTKDSVLTIARKIRGGTGGKLVRPLPKRHRALAGKLLERVK